MMLRVFTITTAESSVIAATVIPMETTVFFFVMEGFPILIITFLQKQAGTQCGGLASLSISILFVIEMIKL